MNCVQHPTSSVAYEGNISRNRNDSEEGRYCQVVIPVSETESLKTNSQSPSFQSPASTKGLAGTAQYDTTTPGDLAGRS